MQAEGGFFTNGIRALLGCPVFTYRPTYEDNLPSTSSVFEMLKLGEASGYILGFGTEGDGNDQEVNQCGINKSHQYSLIEVFEMTEGG